MDWKVYVNYTNQKIKKIEEQYRESIIRTNNTVEGLGTVLSAIDTIAEDNKNNVINQFAEDKNAIYDKDSDSYVFQKNDKSEYYSVPKSILKGLLTKADQFPENFEDIFIDDMSKEIYNSYQVSEDVFKRIVKPTIVAGDSKLASVGDIYGSDIIRTKIKGEWAMINPQEKSLLEKYPEAEEWLYDNWGGKLVDDPNNPGTKIRAYQDSTDGGGIWDKMGTIGSAISPWISGINMVAGWWKSADKYNQQKDQLKLSLSKVPSMIQNVHSKLRNINLVEKLKKKQLGTQLTGIGDTTAGNYSEIMDSLDDLNRKSRGLKTSSTTDLIEDSIGAVGYQAQSDRANALALFDEFLVGIRGQRQQITNELSAIDLQRQQWESDLAYARKHDEWWENIF
jgi:hypothetical protein